MRKENIEPKPQTSANFSDGNGKPPTKIAVGTLDPENRIDKALSIIRELNPTELRELKEKVLEFLA